MMVRPGKNRIYASATLAVEMNDMSWTCAYLIELEIVCKRQIEELNPGRHERILMVDVVIVEDGKECIQN